MCKIKQLEKKLDHISITKSLEEVKIEIAQKNLENLEKLKKKILKELKNLHLTKIREDNLETEIEETLKKGEYIGP